MANFKKTSCFPLKMNRMESSVKKTDDKNIIYPKMFCTGKNKFVTLKGLKITNFNDLKKSTSQLKLPTIINSNDNDSKMLDEIKEKLQKYCRICAEIKTFMVDIFSKKGYEMRLLQQLQHLENIDKNNTLSTKMCMDCIRDTKASYKLFMQIKKSELKLKSVYDSLNKTLSQENQLNNEDDVDSNDSRNCEFLVKNEEINSNKNSNQSSTTDEFKDKTVCKESSAMEYLEEFDPETLEETNDESLPDQEIFESNDFTNAFIEIENEAQEESNDSNAELNIVIDNEDCKSSKMPNILKRKAQSELQIVNESMKTKTSHTDLRVKIPKLNVDAPVKVNSEQNGVMYITTSGKNPNERLLIKMKKIDKVDKKKKEDAMSLRALIKSKKSMPSEIEKQIELYKKKRVEILGEMAQGSEEVEVEEEEEEVVVSENKTHENDLEENVNKNSLLSKDDSMVANTLENQLERLKTIFKTKNESEIVEFSNYLKKCKIVVSRLTDHDLIRMYENKNKTIVEILSTNQGEENEEEDSIDPFDVIESYDCDYCFSTFPSRDLNFEHEKIHDYKLMHYCEDCKQTFSTHKSKRLHGVTCIDKIKCKFCKILLESKGKKRQHEQKHCDKLYGQLCDRCGEKFKHTGTLDQHFKTKHMQLEKIHQCPECPKTFALKTKLTFHLSNVHVTCRAFLCEDCGSDFKNPASLRHHRERKHQNPNKKKECIECHKMIPIYSLSKHMYTHKDYTIECQHCDKKFKNTSTLKQHLRIHEDQRQYKCDHCGVGFNRRDGLRLHLKVHDKPNNGLTKECSCQLCGKKFSSHSMLVIHRNREHKDNRKYTCHICNRSMISKRSLEWHLTNIHNEPLPEELKENSTIDLETKRVTCIQCNKSFKTEMILRTHVKNSHNKKEPMNCLDCDLKFTSEVRLKHHMMIKHERTEGTFSCAHCDKRFVNLLRLKTHLVAHSTERPHPCDICGFKLKTKIQLVKHKQNRHSTERPLQCRYCTHKCKQVSALVCHERTHTNERPYFCRVCKQRFKYLGDKNKHERRHEALGGTGFKRIVLERDPTRSKKKKSKEIKSVLESEFRSSELREEEEEEEENVMIDAEIEDCNSFESTVDNIKLEGETTLVSNNEENVFPQIFVESPTNNSTVEQIHNLDYAKDVANQLEQQIITSDMLSDNVLPSGTVIQLQEKDETGQYHYIPILLSDLSDNNADVNLTRIIYEG